MRYVELTKFQVESIEYDPQQSKEIVKVINFKECRANVTDVPQEVIKVAFGDWRKGTKVIRILNSLPFNPTHVIYRDKKYKVAMKRNLSRKNAFIVEEVTK